MEAFFNMNEFIRDKIKFTNNTLSKKGYDKEDIYHILVEFFSDLSKSKRVIDQTFYLSSLTCMYADTYKILLDKYKNNTFSKDDAWYYYFLDSNNSILELIDEMKNPNLLYELISYSSSYIEFNDLGKRKIFKNMTLDNHKKIQAINLNHKYDIKIYGSYIPTKQYVQFFKEVELENNAIINIDQIENIENFLKDLYKTDRKNFLDNFKDMLKSYYKWTKYITFNDTKGENLSEKLKMLSLIEKSSIDNLAKVAISTKDFLYNLIDEYIYHEIIPTEEITQGKKKIIVTKEMVDAFVIKNTNKSILNKLEIENKSKKK